MPSSRRTVGSSRAVRERGRRRRSSARPRPAWPAGTRSGARAARPPGGTAPRGWRWGLHARGGVQHRAARYVLLQGELQGLGDVGHVHVIAGGGAVAVDDKRHAVVQRLEVDVEHAALAGAPGPVHVAEADRDGAQPVGLGERVRIPLARQLARSVGESGLGSDCSLTGGLASPMSAPPVEACTIRCTPARRAASSTRKVPSTFDSKLPTGSCTEPTTDPAAARWTIASTPSRAASSASTSRISPLTSSACTPARCASSPVDRLSSTRTRYPLPTSRRTTVAPTKPAPPVTRISSIPLTRAAV